MNLRTLLALTLFAGLATPSIAEEAKPLRVLVVAGGCCHDYANQKEILKKGIEARVNATVTVIYDATKSTKPLFDLYKKDGWYKDFDVIVHDECAADITDAAYVENVLKAHREGVPAVNLHCAMHSYRWGKFQQPVKVGDDNSHWYEMLGLQSTGHGAQLPIAIKFTDKDSPITKGLADWTTINEELYNNVQVLGGKALANGTQVTKTAEKKDKDGKVITPAKESSSEKIVVWTNEYGDKKTRIFSTTIGHNNKTVEDDRYLDLVTRGLLWSVNKLDADGKALPGYGAKK
jgi:type 1 glutamine amidotransferase